MEGDVEAMKMSDRKKKILQIVVDEYINTAVPVSSKNIAEKHLQGVSSATVRNELASLEELGYLTQFHTSGGRVPSPQAYRFYIEELMERETSPTATSTTSKRRFRISRTTSST